jgi:hypothetical protein
MKTVLVDFIFRKNAAKIPTQNRNTPAGFIVLFSAIAYFLGYCKIAMEYYNSNVIMQV